MKGPINLKKNLIFLQYIKKIEIGKMELKKKKIIIIRENKRLLLRKIMIVNCLTIRDS